MFALLHNLNGNSGEMNFPPLIRPENEAGNISQAADFAYGKSAGNFAPNAPLTSIRVRHLIASHFIRINADHY